MSSNAPGRIRARIGNSLFPVWYFDRLTREFMVAIVEKLDLPIRDVGMAARSWIFLIA